MDKKRAKIVLAVLNTVTNKFPETNEFIDSTLTEECEKERITVDEVINLFTSLKVKVSLDKYFLFLDLVLKYLFFLFIDMESYDR